MAFAAAVAMLGLQLISSAAAQSTYPSHTVRFILPYGAASATDIAARLFADGLSKLWGKPVVVEDRPGGDALVSLSAFAQAKDDHVLVVRPGRRLHCPALYARYAAIRSVAQHESDRQRFGRRAHRIDAGIDEDRHHQSTGGAGALRARQA